MFKKACTCLLCAILILAFVGCNKDKTKEITSPEDLIGMSKAEVEEIYKLGEQQPNGYKIENKIPNDILDGLNEDNSLDYDIYINFSQDESECAVTYLTVIEKEDKDIVMKKINAIYDKIVNSTKKDITYEGSTTTISDIPENYDKNASGFGNDFETNNGNSLHMTVTFNPDEIDNEKITSAIRLSYGELKEIDRI